MKKFSIVVFLFIFFLFFNFNNVKSNNLNDETIVFIKFKNKIDENLLKYYEIKVIKKYDLLPLILAKINKNKITILKENNQIEYIEKNKIAKIIKNNIKILNAKISQETKWNIKKIRADMVWSETKGSGIQVAVLDTGIDRDHVDLYSNIVWGRGLVGTTDSSNYEDWKDYNGHGTFVTGLIAAIINNQGISGVSPEAEIYAIKVCADDGSCDYGDVVEGIEWAIKGPDGIIDSDGDGKVAGDEDDDASEVINLSLGGPPSNAIRDAINQAINYGITVVAAAGNIGDGDPTTDDVIYPAKYPEVISVAASDSNDEIPTWSSDGSVDVAAPGVNVVSTFPGNLYAIGNGTSFAAPHVSGIVALIQSGRIRENMSLISPPEIEDIIKNTSVDIKSPGYDVFSGYGRVDSREAYNKALNFIILTIKVYDKNNNPLKDAIINIYFEGNLVNSGKTDEEGIANLSVKGERTVIYEINWMDVSVKNETINLGNENLTLNVIVDVFSVKFNVYDLDNDKLKDTEIKLIRDTGQTFSYITDSNGVVNINQFPFGNYSINAYFQDIKVLEEEIEINSNIEKLLNVNVLSPVFLIYDKNKEIVKKVTTTILHPNGTEFDLNISHNSSLNKFPVGNYEIKVFWKGVIVFKDTITLQKENILDLSIYNFNLKVLDSKENILEKGYIVLTYPNGTSEVISLNGSSLIFSKQPGYLSEENPNSYFIQIIYDNIKVFEGNFIVNSSTVNLISNIFYIDLEIVGTHGRSVANVNVVVFNEKNKINYTRNSNDVGFVSIKVPIGEIKIFAFYKNIKVYFEKAFLNSNIEKMVFVSIHDFIINLKTDFDKVSNVTLILENKTINFIEKTKIEKGKFILKNIPGNYYILKMIFKNIIVYNKEILINGTSTKNIEAKIYKVKINVKDARGIFLKNAILNLLTANFTEKYEIKEGKIEIILPGISHVFTVIYLDTEVFNKQFLINSSKEIDLITKVGYLKINTMNLIGIPLNDVELKVYSKGLLILSSNSKNGIIELLLPYGEYTLMLKYLREETLIKEDIKISKPDTIKNIYVNALIFNLNLIESLVFISIILFISLLSLYLIKKKKIKFKLKK